MKHEYKKQEKELYSPKQEAQVVVVPKQKFFCIKGKGDPNKDDFSQRVGVLYSLAYAVKMMPKGGILPQGYFEYTVYPLEGLWDISEEGKKNKKLEKEQLQYTIMIRQPDFVTKEVVEKAFTIAKQKKPHPLLEEAYFDEIEEELCIQILHMGSYDSEPTSFAKLHAHIEQNQYELKSLVHREIYLSNANKTPKDKLKTILRYQIKKR